MARRSTPRPEVIDGGDWIVQRSHVPRVAHVTGTEAKGGTMTVPLDLDDAARGVRLHELTHVHITPRGPEWEDALREHGPALMNLCEDARVHRNMYAQGNRSAAVRIGDIITDEEIAGLLDQGSDLDVAGFAVAVQGTDAFGRLKHAAEQVGRSMIVDSAANLSGHHLGAFDFHYEGRGTPRPTFEQARQLARQLAEVFDDDAERDDEGEASDGGNDQGIAERPLPYIPPHGEGEGQWRPASVHEPRAFIRLPAKMRGVNRPRPGVRGRRLRRVGRLASDGAVFADRPPTKGGGAVLLDCSGSMSLHPGDVLALMTAFPAGVIAGYGTSARLAVAYYAPECTVPEGDEAAVVILARNGKRVSDDVIAAMSGGTNGCDLFALEWLAAQRGPRYWVSDGMVNGKRTTAQMALDCLAVVKRASVRRVLDVSTILAREAPQ